MEYLLKASAIIVIFYTCYKVFLHRDTFFEQNRWFLMAGLVVSVLLPLIVIPIYIEAQPINFDNLVFVENASTTNATETSFNISLLLNSVYFIGVVVFVIRFILQITSLLPLIMNGSKQKMGRYHFITTTQEVSPFSFFNLIVFNPKSFSDVELEQILTHEKVHVHQYHTLDIIISELACIVFWFNPFIWLYNKDLKQNLEFIADKNAINDSNCKKSYQYTLLKTIIPTHQLALTNNFYTSLIKKRIVMLHKSKSKKINLLKYTLVIPILALFLMSFNTEEVMIEKTLTPTNSNSHKKLPVINKLPSSFKPNTESQPIKKSVSNNFASKTSEISSSSIEVIITKDYTDSDFENLKTKFNNEGYTLKVKGIKRNKQNEITSIKIDVSSKSSNANYNIDTDEAISPIKISIDDKGGNISIGNSHIKNEKNTVFVTGYGNNKKRTLSDTENNVYVISSDDENDDNVQVNEFIIKNGDSMHVKKFHKKIKLNDDHSNLSWTTDSSENKKIIITGKSTGIKIASKDGKEPLFIVDGKVISKKEMNDIHPNSIEKVEVLKGDGAIKNYGEDAANGVILIKKKDTEISNLLKLEKTSLYILDGKEITTDEMNDINPDKIDGINVLKGESATKKYGDKGKNGVVIITLKKE
ncbi:M56 family metallopeptidase [Yeosuana marina]|uniref:M56 family metallopeptidase n=1 Tax=Yeosuana marina TaxID=1565536 RepID=UPI001422822B|nr:M56 family metallopeptidase [Yeosuana marina]